jgi:cytochrome-b5 reductase
VHRIDEPGTLELLIKRYPNGKASTYLHSLTPGETLFFLTAIPGYKWTPNAHAHVTMIAGGAGITPIFQLTRGILQNPEDKTAITLIFGINSDADALFKKEFDEFETKYPGRFKAVYTVSNPVEGSKLRKGYVTKTLLEEVLGEEKSEKVFVCGPPKMEEALTGKKGILQELGFAKGQVHKF